MPFRIVSSPQQSIQLIGRDDHALGCETSSWTLIGRIRSCIVKLWVAPTVASFVVSWGVRLKLGLRRYVFNFDDYFLEFLGGIVRLSFLFLDDEVMVLVLLELLHLLIFDSLNRCHFIKTLINSVSFKTVVSLALAFLTFIFCSSIICSLNQYELWLAGLAAQKGSVHRLVVLELKPHLRSILLLCRL